MSKIGAWLLNLFYPSLCPFCGKVVKEGICSPCREKKAPIAQPYCYKCGRPLSNPLQEYCRDCQKGTHTYDQGLSLWRHEGQVEHAIYQFKFHNKRYYGKVFGLEMAKVFGKQVADWKIEEIIPIPLHKSKLKKRGYNQSGLLADTIGFALHLPVNHKKVVRLHNTKPQKELGPGQRRDNLKGAFGVLSKEKKVQNVLLIDDIYTTGNTMDSVARILKKAGTKQVYFLSLSIR